MAIPGRNADPKKIVSPARTFFATTKTSMGRRLLQSERNALLLVDVLRSLVREHQLELHDFVIMPDHVHLLITVNEGTTIEKAMQLVKGRFSRHLSREFGHIGEVWQRGFSETRVIGREIFRKHVEYIAENPVKAGLISSGESYPFCYPTLAGKKAQGLKPTG
jgi:putative transposase